MVQPLQGTTCTWHSITFTWFNLQIVQPVHGTICRWYNLHMVQPADVSSTLWVFTGSQLSQWHKRPTPRIVRIPCCLPSAWALPTFILDVSLPENRQRRTEVNNQNGALTQVACAPIVWWIKLAFRHRYHQPWEKLQEKCLLRGTSEKPSVAEETRTPAWTKRTTALMCRMDRTDKSKEHIHKRVIVRGESVRVKWERVKKVTKGRCYFKVIVLQIL